MIIHECIVACKVFADDVKLEVDYRAYTDIFEVRVFVGVRNYADRHISFVALYVRFADSKTDAVDGDRTFVHAEVSACDHIWCSVVFEAVVPTAVGFACLDTYGCLVYVTLHDVSVEAVANLHGSFQVDIVADFEYAEVGAVERFLHGSDGIKVTFVTHDSQADAVVCDGLVDGCAIGKWVAEREVLVGLFGLNLDDLSHSFYDTTEHI